jgi:hypothetical protein
MLNLSGNLRGNTAISSTPAQLLIHGSTRLSDSELIAILLIMERRRNSFIYPVHCVPVFLHDHFTFQF